MLFPHVPERTRLFRLFKTHQGWAKVFLASPTVLGAIDTYGIELIHPMREGRSPQQIGRKGLSNQLYTVIVASLTKALRLEGCPQGLACGEDGGSL